MKNMDERQQEELRLLRALWDFVWNDLATTDYGDHAGMTWAEDQHLSDLASAVEDHDLKYRTQTSEAL